MKELSEIALALAVAWCVCTAARADVNADADTARLLPVPDAGQQARILATVKDVFKAEYNDSSTAGRDALARKLLEEAEHEEPAARFVMLEQARDLAAKCGDLKTALKSIDLLGNSYVVDASSMKVASLNTVVSARAGSDARSLAEASADIARQTARGEEIEAAAKAAELLETAATALHEQGFSALAQFRSDDAKWAKREDEGTKAELARLAKTRDDAEINSEVGRFACFVLGNFDRGLPLLAKGANPDLKEIAAADLAATQEPQACIAIGDRWWKLAQMQHDNGKRRILGRAGYWYALALPDVSGLEKVKLQKRLAESRPAWLSEMPMHDVVTGAWGGVGIGTTGAENPSPIMVNGEPSPHGLGTHPPVNGSAHVSFDLDRQFMHLEAAVAVNDTGDRPTATPVTFRVVGDGRELWRSKRIGAPGIRFSFLADVTNVSKLELFADCPGNYHGCHCVWVEPELYPW